MGRSQRMGASEHELAMKNLPHKEFNLFGNLQREDKTEALGGGEGTRGKKSPERNPLKNWGTKKQMFLLPRLKKESPSTKQGRHIKASLFIKE